MSSWGSYACVGAESIWEVSILATQCFCEPKTALKYKVYFLLKITTLDKQNVIALGLLKWFQILTEDLKKSTRTSLVVQWLRIHLPMQGTQVSSLVWEDPTCHGATKPMHRNYWGRELQLLKRACLERVLCSKRSHCTQPRVASLTSTRESPQQKRRPSAAKNKIKNL